MDSMVMTSVWMFGGKKEEAVGPVARRRTEDSVQGEAALEAMSLEELLYFALVEGKREA